MIPEMATLPRFELSRSSKLKEDEKDEMIYIYIYIYFNGLHPFLNR